MDKDQKKYICEKLKFKEAKTGEEVIKQGDVGDEFFIIIKGTVSVFVNHKPCKAQRGNKDDLLNDTSDEEDRHELTFEEYVAMSEGILNPREESRMPLKMWRKQAEQRRLSLRKASVVSGAS